MLIYPNIYIKKVEEITIEMLQKNKIKALILDIDNTLIDYEENMEESVKQWAKDLKGQGTKLIILSNTNKKSKVEKVAKTLEMFSKEYDFEELIPISALKGKNVDSLVKLMVNKMPEGPQYYPEDMITDVQERFIVVEIVREKALKNLRDEVPHGIAVDVIQMKQNEKGTYHIEVDLICEKDSHKGIIIGKDGAMLKKIGSLARIEMEQIFGTKVNLKTWVKVKEDWQDDSSIVKRFKLQ